MDFDPVSIRDGIDIQQKFVEKFFSLTENNGVLKHFRDYADFLKKGGKYQIPKDFYEIVIKLWEMPQEEAAVSKEIMDFDPVSIRQAFFPFDASIEFARFNGVAENQILKSKSDIDSYFLL